MKPLIIPLYQHAPLIHFQHDQVGATLRASEVKPRLDKWLKDKHGWKPNTHPKLFALTDEKNQESLNYRMRIIAREEDTVNGLHNTPAKQFANYFADMGEGNPDRNVTMHQRVLLSITTPIDELQKVLTKKAIAPFFLAHNFGMRGSKGFGSFSPAVRADDANAMNWVAKFHVGNKVANQSMSEKDTYLHLFHRIEFVNRALRGGLNQFKDPVTGGFAQGPYMKPLLFQYAMEKGITWEKKVYKSHGTGAEWFGKENIYQDGKKVKVPKPIIGIDKDKTDEAAALINQIHGKSSKENEEGHVEKSWPVWYEGHNRLANQKIKQATVRDALGLSTNQSWPNWSINPVEKKSVNGTIARAPSPLTFVPIRMKNGFAVYLFARQPEKIYLEHTIRAQLGKNNRNTVDLQIFPGFSMKTFLKKYCNPQTIRACTLDPAEDDKLRHEELITIFQQIKDHLQLGNIQAADDITIENTKSDA